MKNLDTLTMCSLCLTSPWSPEDPHQQSVVLEVGHLTETSAGATRLGPVWSGRGQCSPPTLGPQGAGVVPSRLARADMTCLFDQ